MATLRTWQTRQTLQAQSNPTSHRTAVGVEDQCTVTNAMLAIIASYVYNKPCVPGKCIPISATQELNSTAKPHEQSKQTLQAQSNPTSHRTAVGVEDQCTVTNAMLAIDRTFDLHVLHMPSALYNEETTNYIYSALQCFKYTLPIYWHNIHIIMYKMSLVFCRWNTHR